MSRQIGLGIPRNPKCHPCVLVPVRDVDVCMSGETLGIRCPLDCNKSLKYSCPNTTKNLESLWLQPWLPRLSHPDRAYERVRHQRRRRRPKWVARQFLGMHGDEEFKFIIDSRPSSQIILLCRFPHVKPHLAVDLSPSAVWLASTPV
jgi:hypothetical protein